MAIKVSYIIRVTLYLESSNRRLRRSKKEYPVCHKRIYHADVMKVIWVAGMELDVVLGIKHGFRLTTSERTEVIVIIQLFGSSFEVDRV